MRVYGFIFIVLLALLAASAALSVAFLPVLALLLVFGLVMFAVWARRLRDGTVVLRRSTTHKPTGTPRKAPAQPGTANRRVGQS